MIKVSVMYPNTPNTKFDHDYYRERHMPMIKDRLGTGCERYTIDMGLAGSSPGTAPTYVAMCHVFSESIEAFQAGMAPHAEEIFADIRNFTDLVPVIQISEVVVG